MSTSLVSEAGLAYLKAHYPTGDSKELAAKLGIGHHQLLALARRYGIKKAPGYVPKALQHYRSSIQPAAFDAIPVCGPEAQGRKTQHGFAVTHRVPGGTVTKHSMQ